MPCKINNKCIACGDCEPHCPLGAIREGDYIYEIDGTLCNDCSGYYKGPRCIDVCPIEGAIEQYAQQQ